MMNDETKRHLKALIETLPDYKDSAWEINLDGIKCDVNWVRNKLIQLVSPTSNAVDIKSQFNDDLFRVINDHVKRGLSKPDLVAAMKWATGNCELS